MRRVDSNMARRVSLTENRRFGECAGPNLRGAISRSTSESDADATRRELNSRAEKGSWDCRFYRGSRYLVNPGLLFSRANY